MKKLRRKPCDGSKCSDPAFFRQSMTSPPAAAPFFSSTSTGDAPTVQKEEAAKGSGEEEKDPLTEGLKTTGEQLFKHEPFKLWFKKWYEPQLGLLKNELWEKASPGEKAIMLGFAGVNLGMVGMAFSQSPEFRSTLSDVNIGAPLGLIPYSPVEGFKYKLPGAGKSDLGLSADFTLNPYLDLWKNRPAYMPNALTFGLDSTYDLSGKGGFNLTGGKVGLEFMGGALKAQGSIFNQSSISPYPMLLGGTYPMDPTWLMKEVPGMPDMKTGPGMQFMLNADLMKMPWFRRMLGERK
jgi:hypothetical protein